MSTFHADLTLARRYSQVVDRILVDHVRAVAKINPQSGATAMPVADGYALYYGKGTPPGPNRVTGLGMAGPVTKEHLQAAEAFYAERELPCVVGVVPLADTSLTQVTTARGYGIGVFRNVLACPVAAASDSVLPTDDPHATVEVHRASTDEANLWARVVGSGFAELELDAPPVPRLATFQCPDTVCYFGRVEGIEAGGGAITIRDGFAYIWDVSTRPAFRRRGVQQAIYYALLKEAARAGCDMAGLASEVAHASQRNAERAGFRVIYTAAAVVRQLPGAAQSQVI